MFTLYGAEGFIVIIANVTLLTQTISAKLLNHWKWQILVLLLKLKMNKC